MEYTAHYESPLGGITLASDGEAIIGLWFDGQKYFADTLDRKNEQKELPVFQGARVWLDQYFSGKTPDGIPPLCPKGTAFRKAVWEVLLTIPCGSTMTYGEIAEHLAKRKGMGQVSPRAVGGAVGHNPISLMIPCHRVVGAKGQLTGYAGGLPRKEKLLEMEREGQMIHEEH